MMQHVVSNLARVISILAIRWKWCPALLQLEGNTLSPGHSSLHTKTSSESPTLCGLKHKCALEVAVCLCCNWLPKHKDKFERDDKVGNKMSGLSEGSACGLSLAKLSCVSISFYILYHLVSSCICLCVWDTGASQRISENITLDIHWTLWKGIWGQVKLPVVSWRDHCSEDISKM